MSRTSTTSEAEIHDTSSGLALHNDASATTAIDAPVPRVPRRINIVRNVTLPLFKLNETGLILLIMSPFYKGKNIASEGGGRKKMEPPTMLKVRNVEFADDGPQAPVGEIMANEVLKRKLIEDYVTNADGEPTAIDDVAGLADVIDDPEHCPPGLVHSYVGKTFLIQKAPPAPGKDYATFNIAEVTLED